MLPEPETAANAADELTDLLLDHLLPALQAYQLELGHQLRLGPVELVCVDEARRRSPVSLSLVGRCTGRTRSAVVKLVRRLEALGHVDRIAVEGRREVSIALRPHAERDAEYARLRGVLRTEILETLITNRLATPDGHRTAAIWTAVASGVLGSQAQRLLGNREDERHRAQQRRARLASGLE